MRATRNNRPVNGRGRRLELSRYFHDDSAVRGSAGRGASALTLRFLANAVSFSTRALRSPTVDDGDPSSLSAVTAFGDEQAEYDPSGRVEPPDDRAESAAWRVRARNVEQAQDDRSAEVEAPEAAAPEPTEAAAPEPTDDEAPEAAPPGDSPPPPVSSEEQQKLAALDEEDEDGNAFLQKLRAITEQPNDAPVPEPEAKPEPAAAQSRHAVFDQLTPLLQRAQTFDLGTHRVDRRRLDAIAASVLAEDEEKEHADSAEPSSDLPAPSDEPQSARASAPEDEEDGEELNLDPNELRQAIAQMPAKSPQDEETSADDAPASTAPTDDAAASAAPSDSTREDAAPAEPGGDTQIQEEAR